METASEFDIPTDQKLRTWLFNPFHYIAGSQALTIGLGLILAMSLIGAITNSHFDGLLDFHTGRSAPLWVFVSVTFPLQRRKTHFLK